MMLPASAAQNASLLGTPLAEMLRCSMAAAALHDERRRLEQHMFAYVLTFVACLGAHGHQCRTVELPWDGNLMQCMLFGQQLAAQWTNEHPGWALDRGYRCASGRSA